MAGIECEESNGQAGGKPHVKERKHGVVGRRSCKSFFYGSPPPIKTPEIWNDDGEVVDDAGNGR